MMTTEERRVQRLHSLNILDTPDETNFDQITEIISRILNTPIALISLVDKERQWFKSCKGLSTRETPRNISFCTYTIEQDDLFVVEDSLKDPRFISNPLCIGEPHIRYYAGMPLKTSDGLKLGTLCVIDRIPRQIEPGQLELLKVLASHVVNLIEQRQATQELAKLAQQFHDVQQIAHTGVWSCDLRTGEIEWSEEIYNIHGVPNKSKIIKENFIGMYKPADQERLNQAILNAATTGLGYDQTLEMINNRGEQKVVRSMARAVWENNTVIGLKGIFQDVTEKTRLDRETSNFFDLSVNLMGIANPKGYFVKINHAWKALGYTEDEILSRPFTEFVHPDDLEDTKREFQSIIESRAVRGYVNRYIKKNGDVIFLQWYSSLDPATGNVYAVAVDVTKRKAEEAINETISEARTKFIELAHDKKTFFDLLLKRIIALTHSQYGFIGEIQEDKIGRFLKVYAFTNISWNEETRKIYEDSLIHGFEFHNLGNLFGEVIKTEKLLIANDPKNHPKSGGLPKGHPALNAFLGIPIHYANRFIGMIGMANRPGGYDQEIVEQLQPLFDAMGGMLFSLIQDEAIENQKRMLIHNSKLASLGTMAAGVGHEINNPLAILVGQLDIIRQELEDKGTMTQELQIRLDKAEKASERIEHIVRGLRGLARGDQSEFMAFDLSQIVLETCEFVEELLRKEGIKILKVITPNLKCFGNRSQIQQVLVNLINNAKDALKDRTDKSIRIDLSAQSTHITLAVSDSGCGIADSIKDKIFDPFFTTKPVNEGTGIGLSLSAAIIKDHKGEILVDSKVGEGTTITVKLPLTDIQVKPPLSLTPLDRSYSEKVLIVDDEEDLRNLLKKILEKFGFSVLDASQGEDALVLAEKNPDLSLIISDIRMPKMDGAEFLKRLRLKGYAGPFFFITGGDQASMDLGNQHQGVVDKPFTADSIMSSVKSALKTRS